MRRALLTAVTAAVILVAGGCSSDQRSSVETQVRSAVTDVSTAVDDAANNAAEAAARNIAAQQGAQQFKDAGHELDGDLTCTAQVTDDVARLDINCTGTTTTGGAAVLTGTTDEVPGASLDSLKGQFTGTVDGSEVFTTQQLG